jgi:hypothetical protein
MQIQFLPYILYHCGYTIIIVIHRDFTKATEYSFHKTSELRDKNNRFNYNFGLSILK